jgi:hypothetical protein
VDILKLVRNHHFDFSPVVLDFAVTLPHSLKIKFEHLFLELKTELENSFQLLKNAEVIVIKARTQLHRTMWLSVGAALLAGAGGVGAAVVPPEYKKTRRAFVFLALSSSALSIVSALILHQMYVSTRCYQSFFERK